VVRNRIKGFAQKKVTLPPGRHKLVILDEADRYVIDEFFSLCIFADLMQYDPRCPAGAAPYNGNLLDHH
jgi:hypothetical protein